jgi:LPXTG-site transpeptidase (sortase) family protein
MLRNLSKNAKITISILFAFMGLCLIGYTYFDSMKVKVFDNKNRSLIEQVVEFDEDAGQELSLVKDPEETPVVSGNGRYDYIGYLKVPEINLDKGFTSLENPYNYVNYNVQLIKGSDMPNVKNGNLILAGHNGTSSVGYFNKLHTLSLGATAQVEYNNKTYNYKLVNIYNVTKDGTVEITRNSDVKTLTLITCTYQSKTEQTVFIFELINEG